MSEETQIRQIEGDIDAITRRIRNLRLGKKSWEADMEIANLEFMLADLRGSLEWHRRRLYEQTTL